MSDGGPLPLRWGLLGTARINHRLLDAMPAARRSTVEAVASRTADGAEKFAAETGIPTALGSYEALLEMPDIDVVYVSLPNGLHHEWSVRAAQAGKHVLCEKPLALTREQVADMARAARDNGVVLQEASMMRFHPQTHRVRDIVASGRIGEVRSGRAIFTFTLEATGDIRWSAELGGGSLWDLGCYPITFFHYVFDAEPVEVMGWSLPHGDPVDKTFSAQIRFADGSVAQFVSSFEAVPTWGAEIVGSLGRIVVTYPWLSHRWVDSEVTVTATGGPRSAGTFGDGAAHLEDHHDVFENVNAYMDEVLAMERMILDGEPPLYPLDEVETNVAIAAALHESAALNRPVELA